MIHADFTYDGISCDEYGVYVAEFDSIEVGKVGVAQATDLSTVTSRKGEVFHITSQHYSSPLQFEMQVFSKDFGDINQEHERILKKWLMQRGKYKWFSILDKRYANLWFKANIHSPENIRVNDVVGISFQVSCNAAYAYSDLIGQEFDFSGSNKTALFYVDNDDDSVLYPDMEITMLSAGDLTIRNNIDTNKSYFKITGLQVGEIVTINGELPSIESTKDTLHKKIYDRFSKYWFWIADGENTITVSNNCILKLNYREKRKVGAQ